MAKVLVDDEELSALLDSGSVIDLAPYDWARREGFVIHPLSELTSKKIDVQGVGGAVSHPLGWIEYNLKVPGVQGFDEDRVAFLVADKTKFAARVPLIIGTGTLDRVIACVKESEITPLSYPWQRVRHARMLSGRKAQAQVGHELYSNKGYSDLADVDEIVKAKSRVVVPPGTNRMVRCKADLVLLGASIYVVTEHLKKDDPHLQPGLHVRPCLTDYRSGSQSIQVEVYNTTDRALVIDKNMPVARMYTADAVPERVMMTGTLEALDEQEVPEPRPTPPSKLTTEERREKVLELLDLSGLDEWDPAASARARDLLSEFHDIFSLDKGEIGCTDLVEHEIELTDETPFKERPRSLPEGLIGEVREHLNQMLDCGAIKPSNSPWSNAVVLVRKKDGSLRFCIDFRRLNARTKKDAFPLPRVQESLDCLRGCAWFSTMDCISGFWQTPMAERCKQYTAFTVGNLGFFECERMPFGLCNAPATFQRLMQNCLGELNYTMCIIYLDDIVVFSRTEHEHVERLRRVFERLRAHGLKLKPSKCCFFMKEINYLGHRVSKQGVLPTDDKLRAVAATGPPSTVTEVRQFLGLVGYYRRFIRDFAKIANPLNKLLEGKNKDKKKEAVILDGDAIRSYHQLQGKLLKAPVLAYPDPEKEYLLETDASNIGLGAVLSQKQADGRYHPVAYASRSVSNAERNYHSTKLEFLAMKWAIAEQFAYYLMGKKFKVRTDNNPLTYCLTTAKLDAVRQRWIEELAPFDFSIEYQKGRDNTVADVLSRTTSRLSASDTDAVLARARQERADQLSEMAPDTVKALLEDVTNSVARRACSLPKTADESALKATVRVSVPIESGKPEQMHITDWKKEQAKIQEYRMIVKWIRTHRSKPCSWDEKLRQLHTDFGRLNKTPEGKALIRVADKLVLNGGLLYYRHDNDLEAAPILRFVVPPQHRRRALDGCHRDAGHFGHKKTHSIAEDRFWWPTIKHDVEVLCQTCGRCEAFKGKSERAPLKPIVVSSPLELVHIDFTGFETNTGDLKANPQAAAVLVIQDHFTRFIRAFRVPDQQASTVARVLYDEFISIFGPPQRLLSDNGKAFTAEVVEELCRQFGVERSLTTPYHAQCNGMVERSNAILRDMVGKLEPWKKSRWSDHLPELTHAFNAARSAVTGYSPHFLMFGRRPRLPIDFYFPTGPALERAGHKRQRRAVDEVKNRIGFLRDAYQAALVLTQEQAAKQKVIYDRKASVTMLQANDVVLVSNAAYRGQRKLIDRWGDVPHRVITQVEGLPCYIIEDPSGRQRTLHRNRLFLTIRPNKSDPPLVLSKLVTAALQAEETSRKCPVDTWVKDHPPIGSLVKANTRPDLDSKVADLWQDTLRGGWFYKENG